MNSFSRMIGMIQKNRNNSTDNSVIIASACLAFCGICGIVFYMKIGAETGNFLNNFSNNILYASFLFPLFAGWKKILGKVMCWRQMVISAIGGLFFGSLLVVGAQLDYFSGIVWNFLTVVKCILLSTIFCLIIYFVFEGIKHKTVVHNDIQQKSLKIRLLTFGVIFGIWFLTFIALFPGVYGYDAPNQILQGLGKIPVSSYQPIIHTFIMGKCVEIGHAIWGSYEMGLGIYSFLQMLFMVYVATRVCIFVYERTGKKSLWIATVLFFTILPLHSVFSVSSTKDIIFTGLFILLYMKIINIAEEPYVLGKSFWNAFSYMGLVFLLLWFRSNGIYVIIFMFIFALALLRKVWKKILLLTFIPIFLFLSLQSAVMVLGDIRKGDSLREMLSIPCQQLARVYTYNKDSLTEDEKEILFEIIPEDTFSVYPYRQTISDSIKGALDTDKLIKDPIKYLSFYLKIGIKNPKNYIEAAMLNCLATWYPNKYYQDERQYHPYIEVEMIEAKIYNPNYLELERKSLFPVYEQFLVKFFGGASWNRIPLVSSLFTVGTYVWLLLLYVLYIILKKNYVALFPVSLLLGLILTNILGPVSLIRYGYPIIFAAPIILTQFKYINGKCSMWRKENGKNSCIDSLLQ